MKTLKVAGGDFVFDDSGSPVTITGRDKLVQDVFEITVVARNQDGYGAGIGDMIGTISNYIPAKITWALIRACEHYQFLQKSHYILSKSETLKELVHVTTRRNPGSRTGYEFNVLIRNGVDSTPAQVCVLTRPALR